MTLMVIKAVDLIIDQGYCYSIRSHPLIILILIKFGVILSAGRDTRSRTCPKFDNKVVYHLECSYTNNLTLTSNNLICGYIYLIILPYCQCQLINCTRTFYHCYQCNQSFLFIIGPQLPS